MTNLKIIPNFEKKTAKFEGVIAAGEKIHVTIENVGGFIASTQNLRLRAVGSDGGTLAGFPQENELGEIVEDWSFVGDTIECDLNLNTVQMLEAVPPAARVMVLFVLDNPEDETLYFKSFCTVDHWPRRVGEEEPVDLGGYSDFVQDVKRSIESAEAAIEEASTNAQSAADRASRAEARAKAAQEAATGSVGSAATYASEAAKARDEANSRANSAATSANDARGARNTAESAKSAAETARDEAKGYAESAESTLANAATKAELQAEVERATAAEGANARRISNVDTSLSEETTRAKKAESGLQTAVDEVNGKVDTLIGPIVGDKKLSARAIAAEEVAKVVANAPADLDTLKEIAAYIERDKTGAAQMVANIDANTKAIAAEVKRATDAESALAGRVKTLEDAPPSVEVVAPSADGAGKAADAKAVYEGLEGKLGKSDVVPMASGESGQAADAADAYQQYVAVRQVATTAEEKAIGAFSKADEALNQANGARDWAVTAQMEANAASQAANAAQQTAAAAIPKYPFKPITAMGLTDDNGDYYEDVRLEPYVNSILSGLGLIGLIKVSVESGTAGYMRDLQFTIDLTSTATAPTITWGATFHPRTDAEADFACVAGKRNVYWISEYAEGEFCVAGWQETTGGNAS